MLIQKYSETFVRGRYIGFRIKKTNVLLIEGDTYEYMCIANFKRDGAKGFIIEEDRDLLRG